MGEVSKRLHQKIARMAESGAMDGSPKLRRPKQPIPDVAKLAAEGYDPNHAVYIFINHIASVFSENVSTLPEMQVYAREIGEAEEEYMPSGPPMSPLTTSYFNSWALYDHRIGKTKDTLGSCLIEVSDLIAMNPHQLRIFKQLSESRMGIYEHRGFEGPHVRLRELITDREFVCHPTSGYRGQIGELWYVRVLPPIEPALGNYNVLFTTPYILTGQTKKDWIAYLKRSLVSIKARSEATALHQLLKFGLSKNYWNEFVLLAYHHDHGDAIFLTGIPDMKGTLPHA